MLKLKKLKCLECERIFEMMVGYTRTSHVLPYCDCGSTDIEDVSLGSHIVGSNGMLNTKIPSGFRTLLRNQAKRAGSISNINTAFGEL